MVRNNPWCVIIELCCKWSSDEKPNLWCLACRGTNHSEANPEITQHVRRSVSAAFSFCKCPCVYRKRGVLYM